MQLNFVSSASLLARSFARSARPPYPHLWTLLRMGGVCNILFIETVY